MTAREIAAGRGHVQTLACALACACAIVACGDSTSTRRAARLRAARFVAAVASRPAGLASGRRTRWSAPERIAAEELGSGPPAPVAVASSGDAFAVFTEPAPPSNGSLSPTYRVRAATRPAGGRWQPPATLSQLGVDSQVAVDGRGEATAVWQGPSSVEAAERPPGKGWLPAKAVLTPGGGEPQVAANARGDAVVASPRQAPGRSTGIDVALRPAGGSFSAPRIVSGRENAFEPRVAIDARGDVLVAWRVDSGHGCPVRAAFRRAGGGWSRPRTLSDTHAFCEGGSHRVAIDARGEAIVVWFAQRGGRLYIEAATSAADGRWGARQTLASARTVLHPEVGVDERGDAIVAWWGDGRESARVRGAGRRWSAAQRVSSAPSTPASLAVGARGDALLAWSARGRVVAATSSPAARGWRRSVVAAERTAAFAQPAASLGANGEGIVAWFDDRGLDTARRSSIFE